MNGTYQDILGSRPKAERQGWDSLSKVGLFVGPIALLWLVNLPILMKLKELWFSDENFDGLCLVPLLWAGLIYRNRKEIFQLRSDINFYLIGLVSISCMVVSLLNFKGYVRVAGYVFVLSNFCLLTGIYGWQSRKLWLGIVAFLIFMVPVGDGFAEEVINILQLIFSYLIECLLGVFTSINFFKEGYNFFIDGLEHPLTVADECSGFRSLMGLTIMSVFMAIADKHNLSRLLMVVLSGVLAGMVLNLTRMMVTVALYINGLREYAEGRWHGLLGMVVFCVGFLTISKVSKLIKG